jgi:hypothetical protein
MTARRFTAFLVALIAFAAVAGQFALDADAPGLSNWVARLWDFARYFTYLTLCMAMVHMGLVALGRPVAKNFTASVVLCVIIVGIVYWTLLAPDKPLEALVHQYGAASGGAGGGRIVVAGLRVKGTAPAKPATLADLALGLLHLCADTGRGDRRISLFFPRCGQVRHAAGLGEYRGASGRVHLGGSRALGN